MVEAADEQPPELPSRSLTDAEVVTLCVTQVVVMGISSDREFQFAV